MFLACGSHFESIKMLKMLCTTLYVEFCIVIMIILTFVILAQYLPFIIVFGSVILLFLGLCIYVICVCPSFMRDLQIETKSNDSDDDDDDSGTLTTELTSGISARISSGTHTIVL